VLVESLHEVSGKTHGRGPTLVPHQIEN